MIKHFNVDFDNIITDYKLSYQNANDEFNNKIMQMNNNLQKLYTPKIEELDRISSMYLMLFSCSANVTNFFVTFRTNF